MTLKIGIVGLPNVGKSTLFNALTKTPFDIAQGKGAESANFPFTTIEPNVGVVSVPDDRLNVLAELSSSEKIVPTTIEFVDIAGLVKDAHKGEGLGNKFLSHIREVDAIAHVVRFFENKDIVHVDNHVNPAADAETIETELALADLATVEKFVIRAEKEARGNDKTAAARAAVLHTLQINLAEGKQARDIHLTPESRELIADVPLLTSKPSLYVANLSEVQVLDMDATVHDFAQRYVHVLPLSVKIEQELVELPEADRMTFLAEYNLTMSGLERLIKSSYELLGLITFLTTGPQETRAWTVVKGSTAPVAAGKIHSDMERGFIRAETVAYDNLVAAGSYHAARSAGKVRDEGKNYVVQDGDIFLFKFSV